MLNKMNWMTSGMKTAVMTITPEDAKKMLQNNRNNRPLNPQRIKMYAADMKDGLWQLTHQGILLGKEMAVIDGQNRLTAIVQAGVPVEMMVSHDERIETPLHLVLDRGNARQLTFITGRDKSLIGTANFALEILNAKHGKGRSLFRISDTEAASEKLAAAYEILKNGVSTAARGITAAPIILACCVLIMEERDIDYVVKTFNYMRTSDFTKLQPYPASFFRQVVIDQIPLSRPALFSRAYRAFNSANSNKQKLQVKDSEFAINEAITALQTVMNTF